MKNGNAICKHKYTDGTEMTWEAAWILSDDYLQIKARATSYSCVLGRINGGDRFIAIPDMGISSRLACDYNYAWDYRKLSSLMEETDAVTIAKVLEDIAD